MTDAARQHLTRTLRRLDAALARLDAALATNEGSRDQQQPKETP